MQCVVFGHPRESRIRKRRKEKKRIGEKKERKRDITRI
jgi:hypothetical protein